jgi:DNA ligase-4
MSKWRSKVGNDFYPALRLIIPDKDRDRAMYGLKEKTIAKLLVRVLGINRNSEDAHSLLNWKLPGGGTSRTAGDFAGRCFEIVSKRPMQTHLGSLTVAQVNAMLDKLSVLSKEDDQYTIFYDFYRQMNPEELMWLIRIVLRQMKVGATEKTLLNVWHPDAEDLFNVSSSLRRVCWELYDQNVRLQSDRSQITLMQCFQPQLAAFQLHSIDMIVSRMNATDDGDAFWIEEKLDGERMQMHMMQDSSVPGGMKFGFWSRKAKDYTYLYGNGFEDDNSALTRHLKNCFDANVRSIVLDGEMITWDMERDKIVGFGTLKSAAISEQRNPFAGKQRPLFRVFDCLYLNDRALTKYTLKDRRKALERSVKDVPRRLELHTYVQGRNKDDIERELRRVVADASEGLVVKSPRSSYHHDRNDDWIKVKPEYMQEFGEDLDCIIIGGYYGSGRRGGGISSFLCGLRVDDAHDSHGANPQLCYSFFKVGGGLTVSDYEEIKHKIGDKWQDWNDKKPPNQFIELAGGDRQHERPDVWIQPEDSLVVSVKAASVHTTDQFRTGFTLRFPRFKALREDKDWETALSIQGFHQLRSNAERERKDRQFELDTERKTKRAARSGPKKRRRSIEIAGAESIPANQYAGPDTSTFRGLTFFVMSGCTQPVKRSKPELEQMIKANGGNIVQNKDHDKLIAISETRTVKAMSVQKLNKINIIKPSWLFDCIEQSEKDISLDRGAFLLPYEPCHMYHTLESDKAMIQDNVDEFGDSYCHDVRVESLRQVWISTYACLPGTEY